MHGQQNIKKKVFFLNRDAKIGIFFSEKWYFKSFMIEGRNLVLRGFLA